MVSHDRGRGFGLKVTLGWALAWVGLGLGCAAEDTCAPSAGQEVLVVVVALDRKDNTILAAKTLGPFAPDRPLGPGRSIGMGCTMWTHVHADGPNRSDESDFDEWSLGVYLSFPSAGEVVVDAEWEFPAGNKMDRAETPLPLSPGAQAVLVMREKGKPRVAVQFVVVSAAGQCD